ncbi:MAG: dihydropteroate synthase [Flavipsychrobacter sp.]|nr:dihydropteroate synthase [Flavipsychrobacter sp.]
MLHQLFTVPTLLQSKGQLLDLSTPVVMGILNATPDSFYNKGQDSDMDALLRNAEKMIGEGAKILDIGGASTKPGSAIIEVEEELLRVIQVVETIHKHFPDTWLSVDTYHAQVAREAVDAGAAIINDVSSGDIDAEMLKTVAELHVPYIAMHMQGTPETMQQNPQYTDAVIEVQNYLNNICDNCKAHGIQDVIIDPGFGFGKTTAHNFQLLRSLHTLRILGRPILAGISRKSIVCKPLKVSPANALNGTTALHMIALQQGANILRVHDVKEAVECVKLWGWMQA